MDRAVDEAMQVLLSAPPAGFEVAAGSAEEVARAAQQLIERLCALRADAVAAVEAEGAWRADGASSVQAWVREALGLPGGEAGLLVRTARALHAELPLTRAGLWAGRLSWAQAATLARTVLVTPARRAAVAADGGEATLVEVAATVAVSDLPRVLGGWAHGVDAAGVEADEREVFAQRRVTLAATFGGCWHLEGLLDPVGGAALAAALDAVVGASLGAQGEDRTVTQVRADALVDLARRALEAGDVPQAGGLRPQVFVHVSGETLAGAPASPGAEVSPGEGMVSGRLASWLACDAALTPVAWDSDGRLLDLGRTTRTVPVPLRRAVVARDRRCVFPGCGRSAGWCEAHHVVWWTRGGATALDNLCLLCRYHHRLVHEHDLAITPATNGASGWVFRTAEGRPLRGPPRRSRRRRPALAA